MCATSGAIAESRPLKALVFTGGCCHDYTQLIPLLTSNISHQIKITFDVEWTLDRLKEPKFAQRYDVVIYDVCFDNAEATLLENALAALQHGKPAVILHCGVHAFRNSPKIREWENGIGMRSKVHDPFQAFGTDKTDVGSPILKGFPDHWRTSGDELYQTIELIEDSHPLLKAKSPHDGREHIVCWTRTTGKGRVFATTLGHDLHTVADADYLRLVARGLLWACGRPDQ